MDDPSVLLTNATLQDGRVVDVLLNRGHVAEIRPGLAKTHRQPRELHNLEGYLLLPSAVEPHAHLDKAMLAQRCLGEAGGLVSAIEMVRAAYPSMDEDDVSERARSALEVAVSHGYTAVRTHTACESGIGTRALRSLLGLREAVSEIVDLQVVAHVGMPVTGPEGAEQRALLVEAIGLGANLVGGAPALDPRPREATRLLVQAAAEAGLPIDLHLDETTQADVLTLEKFATQVEQHGLSGRATASHCVSLGQQDPKEALRIAEALAAVDIGVVTLPQTNLYLQGRDETTHVPRGLTAIKALVRAGVTVAGGGDNWRDPFNPLGRIDPFETTALLVAAGHFSLRDAYDAVSSNPRRIMGLPPVAVEVGSPADLLAVRAATLPDAIAGASEDRWVFRRGRLISRTRLIRDVDPARAIRGGQS